MIYNGNIELFFRAVDKIEKFQNYEIQNFEILLEQSTALIVSNHSFIAYDMLFLMNNYYKKTGKILRGVGDHLLFKIPIVKELFLSLGVVDGNVKNINKLIEQDDKIIIYPGGAREAMKSSSEKYQLLWQGRYGFIKLAIKYNIPIIPIVSIGVEDMFHVYANGYTLSFKNIPLPLFKVSPKQKIIHYVQNPIFPEINFNDEKIVMRRMQRKIKKVFKDTINKEVKYG